MFTTRPAPGLAAAGRPIYWPFETAPGFWVIYRRDDPIPDDAEQVVYWRHLNADPEHEVIRIFKTLAAAQKHAEGLNHPDRLQRAASSPPDGKRYA